MSLDPRSRERLEALGRQLPKPLPEPPPKAPATAARHPVETEQHPDRLFRELMAASPDGHVPPHLLERLKQLEANGAASAPPSPAAARPPSPPERRGRPGRRKPETEEDHQLYATFAQLLLEQEENAEG
jgi:hypothetical protein